MTELTFKKQATPSSNRFQAEYVAEGTDYSVTKEEGTFNGITWVARYKGTELANFPRLMDAKRRCSDHAEDLKVKAENNEIKYHQAMQAIERPHETLNASDNLKRDLYQGEIEFLDELAAEPIDGPAFDPADHDAPVRKSFKVSIPAMRKAMKNRRDSNHAARLAYDQSFAQGAPVHMPNSERVQKYARANGSKRLTAKQMRRVRKNANKHNEGFMYTAGSNGYVREVETLEGYSHIGTTPEGLAIMYRFAS